MKIIWQIHIKKTVIRLFVTVWKCVRQFLSVHAQTHLYTMNEHTYMGECVYSIRMCVLAICVYVLIMW